MSPYADTALRTQVMASAPENRPSTFDGPERTAADALDEERSARLDAEHTLTIVDALLESALVGIGLVDRDMRYVRVNSVLAQINNRTPEYHLGRTVREVIGDRADVVEPYMRQVLATGEPVTNRELYVHLEGAPNELRVFLASYFPVRTDDGEVIGIGASVADITRLKRIESDLQDAVRQREEILALVSHDLRNPLGAIQMASTMLASNPQLDDPRAQHQLEMIQRSVRRMEHLIEDLLDMASIQAGRFTIERKSIDAQLLVTEALETIEQDARAKKIALICDTELEGVEVSCDRDRMLQVLGNLLSNAVKFCGPGDTITLRAHVFVDQVVFEVADTGPGIAPADIPHIFEPYWSAHAHARKGTGLGLYITKGIVEAHGGWITVDSTPGVGTTMRFTVPRALS
jgi:PAS domain S-box-containing protein